MSTLKPSETIEAAVAAGENKVELSERCLARLAVSAILAGAFIALGGTLSLIVGYGFPGITAENPAMQKLLSGAMFPIGLILVVLLGTELFTGNNAVLVPAWIKGRYGLGEVLRNWTLVYLFNFVGATGFTYLFVYLAGLTDPEIYSQAAVAIAEAKCSMAWGVVFLKGVGANWCVCLAVWLALTTRSTVGKMLGCWLPVMAFVALGYEHSIANMFYIPLGIMNGAEVGVWQSVTANFIPATLGNIVGGALLVGTLHAHIHFRRPIR